MNKVKVIFWFVVYIAFLGNTNASKISGKGENRAAVQSFFEGQYYIRSIPSENYGSAGTTTVYKVQNDNDVTLNGYPFYMRGQLFLGWSPLKGQWCVIHLEPMRIENNKEVLTKIGRSSKLAFYMGGQKLISYSNSDIESFGLNRRVNEITNKRHGDYTVNGIKQIPGTNNYVFEVEGYDASGSYFVLKFDITTGKVIEGKQ